jgi:hypothetical protein
VYEEDFRTLFVDTIVPLYERDLRERTLDPMEALEHYFNVDHREIYFIEFLAPCQLYGKRWTEEDGGGRVWPPRKIELSTLGLLRFDTRAPDRFEIAINTQEEEEEAFVLTFRQFHKIKQHINISYHCRLTGKDPTHARRLKRYHDEFVQRHFGIPLNWITASGLSRPGYKKTGGNGSGNGVRSK